jgi:hypothetical protein
MKIIMNPIAKELAINTGNIIKPPLALRVPLFGFSVPKAKSCYITKNIPDKKGANRYEYTTRGFCYKPSHVPKSQRALRVPLCASACQKKKIEVGVFVIQSLVAGYPINLRLYQT